jgi:hypothetical protein
LSPRWMVRPVSRSDTGRSLETLWFEIYDRVRSSAYSSGQSSGRRGKHYLVLRTTSTETAGTVLLSSLRSLAPPSGKENDDGQFLPLRRAWPTDHAEHLDPPSSECRLRILGSQQNTRKSASSSLAPSFAGPHRIRRSSQKSAALVLLAGRPAGIAMKV